MSISYIPRVTQLDAAQLDKQLEELFKQQLFYATKYLEPGILQPLLPELELLIRTWIFKYSVYDKKSTFGQQMLSLGYKQDNFSRSKLWWYFGYTVVLKYIRERAIYSFTSNTRIQNIVHKMETFQLIGDILNFLRFIQSGKYPVLIDFILGLELFADKLTREDLTDFSWTRELLWHNFIELIGTAISILNIFGLRRKLSNVLKYVWWSDNVRTSIKSSSAIMTTNTLCACCDSHPVLPYIMGCSHVFCYYCLMANKTADPDFACPKCYYNGKEINKFVMV
ncbi:peroxisome biogenesis factor 2 [Pectinophora gossypiella]|uniref:RING-type E3 ubiquitin transferase (cysteine targeting) n=1 Tax=Pectinophora gossypiella TaxID=13191 RepID=A0A1E1W5F7_PECGO|nr:peroxisome biogenesis factor 2 [Pectinophora gossypiella]